MLTRSLKSLLLMFPLLLSLGLQAQNKQITVKGAFTNCTSHKVSLYFTSGETKLAGESAVDTNGSFNINFEIKTTEIYKLQFEDGMYLALILEPGTTVVIHADLKDLINSLKIEGSQQSEWIYESNVKLNTFKAKLDSINTLYMQLAQKGISDSVKQKLTKDYMSIDSLQIQYLVTFIKDHAESLSCLYIIDRLSIDTYFSTYEVLDSKLYAKYPDNTFAKNFHTRVEGAKKLAIGSVAPEIELPNPDGQNVKLSSLRGKVVLIDFWASWCSPCRRENPNMVRIYKNYNAKGFEIFSVSLDKTKDAWVKAIQDDGLTWTHVSDLKFWQCEAALAYNVTAVPYTVLLDKEGKIVAKGLRGAELEAKLSELFE